MNIRPKSALAGLLAAAVAAGVTTAVALAPATQAADTPPWLAADLSPHAAGTVGLYTADGTPVTSGRVDEPLAAYAVASTTLRTGDTVAALSAYTPQVVAAPTASTGATTGVDGWTGVQLSGATPQASVPETFAGRPTVALDGATTLGQYLAAYPNTITADAYRDVYELRLTTGASGRAFGSTYAVLDLQVTGDTWHLYGQGGSQATATTTTLETPTGARVGRPLTLSATVAPAAAGTVQFRVGATAVGAPVTVDDRGRATTTWTPTSAGSATLTAAFVPADATAFAASTSSGTAVVVASAAATPTVTPTWPAFRYGTATTVRVAVASSPAAAGSVGIVYAGRVLASAPVSGGVARVVVPATALPAGARALVARFTSTAPASVASRDSAPRTVTVAKAVSRVANTAVPTAVRQTSRTAFTFTVTAPGGTVTGSVRVLDGARVLGTVSLSRGRATIVLKLRRGKHVIKAAFLGGANVAAATGTPVTVTSK